PLARYAFTRARIGLGCSKRLRPRMPRRRERGRVRWLACCIVMAFLACSCGGSHPRDATLLDNFRRNRPEFERLVAMFQADKGLGRVGRDFTRPENPARVGISAQRILEYRRLCGVIGASDCIEGYDRTFDALYGASEPGPDVKDPIWIHVSGLGLSIS